MANIYTALQIVLGVLLVLLILLQQRGAGIGSSFGGEGQLYRSKRGVERILFIATIIVAMIFAANAIITFIIA